MSDLIERLRGMKARQAVVVLVAENGAQQAEIARLRVLLGKVFRELDTSQSPGHHHSVAGVWDDYNGDLSGKPCEWCAAWSEVRQEVEQKP